MMIRKREKHWRKINKTKNDSNSSLIRTFECLMCVRIMYVPQSEIFKLLTKTDTEEYIPEFD